MSGLPPTPHLRKANQVMVGVGLALSTGCLAMRIYTKASIMRRFWWDDVFIILAWIFAAAIQATILYGFDHAGLGLHMPELPPLTIITFQRIVLACSIVYLPCLAFAKLALLMLYYRLLYAVKAWVYTLYIVGFVIVGYTIALTIALIFACDPLSKSWNPFILEGSCIDRPGAYLATAATNTASDLVLLLIPIRVISKLHMRLIEKMGLVLVFGIGCLTIVTSILRLATLWPLVTSRDVTYDLALVCTFVIIEANFIILCGCLPYLRQFGRHFAPKWFPAWWASGNTGSSQSTSTPARIIRRPRVDSIEEAIETPSSCDTPQQGELRHQQLSIM